jgi:SAM-dependent methyltransferase
MKSDSRSHLFSPSPKAPKPDLTALPQSSWMRARISEQVNVHLHPGAQVLELGCRAEDDCSWLASEQTRLITADASHEHLASAQANARSSDRHAFVQALPPYLQCFTAETFDLIFSHVGSLDCIEDLSPTFAEIHRVLRPGGSAILCFVNRFSLWETLNCVRRLEFRKAIRRWRNTGALVIAGARYPLAWYHSIGSVRLLTQSHFQLRNLTGLGIISPLIYLLPSFLRRSVLARLLERTENAFSTLPPFSSWGDHYMIVLKKRPS